MEKPDSSQMPDLRRPWCFYVPADSYSEQYGGYVPSIVVEHDSGHYPLIGRGAHSAPWVWGSTLETARAECVRQNQRIGVTPERASQIVTSSMAVSETPRRGRA